MHRKENQHPIQGTFPCRKIQFLLFYNIRETEEKEKLILNHIFSSKIHRTSMIFNFKPLFSG